VAHEAALEAVYAALRAVAAQLRTDPAFSSSIVGDIEISGVDRLDGAAVLVRSRLRVRPLEQWRVRWEFLVRLKEEFARRGIELPTAQLGMRELAQALRAKPG
jgi:moderate conductance mechanosensitive channel